MKNSLTNSFSRMFLIASFIVLLVNTAVSQTSGPQIVRMKKTNKDGKGKNNESVVNSNKSVSKNSNGVISTPPPIVQPNYEEMSKAKSKAVAENDDSATKGVPVTYVGDEKNITEVNYTIDSQQSNFDNLTTMIDVRNNVHASNNYTTLKETTKYNQLLTDITTYRAKFNDDVNKKGFENCSKREQSLFLSFLKQEGKQEEYKQYMSKLKQD